MITRIKHDTTSMRVTIAFLSWVACRCQLHWLQLRRLTSARHTCFFTQDTTTGPSYTVRHDHPLHIMLYPPPVQVTPHMSGSRKKGCLRIPPQVSRPRLAWFRARMSFLARSFPTPACRSRSEKSQRSASGLLCLQYSKLLLYSFRSVAICVCICLLRSCGTII
jgi:hypothetical protein